MTHVAVCVTAPSRAEAEAIGRALVEARLAASVNVVPAVSSFYWWEGTLREGDEAMLWAKTRADLVEFAHRQGQGAAQLRLPLRHRAAHHGRQSRLPRLDRRRDRTRPQPIPTRHDPTLKGQTLPEDRRRVAPDLRIGSHDRHTAENGL